MIPVVFNGANMSAIAPPHSYINAEDFSSVEQLAEYLQLVAKNDSLFASYFWWRDYYKPLVRENEVRRENLCSYCFRVSPPGLHPGVICVNTYTERRVLTE